MGELPPLLTPQGPGVPRARRPGFPRVEDSGTSCSSFVIFRLMKDLPLIRRIRFWYFVSAFPFTSRYWLLHGSPRPCCPVFPLVSFPFLASGYLRLVPHQHDPGSFSSPYACVSLQLLSRSPLRYLQFVRFIRRGLCVHRRSSLFPDFLSDSGSTAPVSGLGFCGPRVAPKRPHTTPPERQRTQGNGWLINISPILEQFTGNRGHWGCFSTAN